MEIKRCFGQFRATTRSQTGYTRTSLPMAAVCLLLFLLGISPAYAQDPVPLNPSFDWFSRDGGTTYVVAWGDVDGDGDLDLAAGGGRQNKIYLNESGTLETDPTWVDNDSGFTYSVAWGDMDGDGDIDLAVGDNNWNKVYLNEEGALGTVAAWVSDENDITRSVAWGDVNGDGNLDLAVGNTGVYSDGCSCYLGDVNRVYMNEGEGLETTATWTSGESDATYSVAWGDVDGDGDLDLAVGNDGQNKVYLNDEGFLETTAAWVSDESESDRTWSVAWGDVDRDGDLDLAVGNEADQNKVYLNEGETLETIATWVSDESNYTIGVAWGDVDGDGDLDLAVGNDGEQNMVYLNEGGALGTTAAWVSDDSDWTWNVAWGDVNGDGDLDLAVGGWDSPNKIYLNEAGSLETAYDWISDDAGTTCGLAWGDVDGDGDLDLAAGNTDTWNKVYLNGGATLQTTPAWTDTVSDNTRSVAWGDVDGDGDLDLAVGNGDYSLSAQNKVYLNKGGVLTTTNPWISSDSDRTFSVAWGDVDGDGDLDLAVGNNGDQNRVYLNDEGTLGVVATWVSDDTDLTRGIAWGDVDGDGDLDLAAGNSGWNKVYLNEGGALETSATWVSDDSDWTYSVAWGDMDGDGDLDLAAGSAYAQNRVYLNESGTLGTTAAWVSSDGSRTYSIAWGDVDGDGDLDLAAGNYGWNKVYVNEGGTLETDGQDLSSSTTESVAWGDVDGDGDLDLAMGTGGADRIKIYRNRQAASPLHLGQTPWIAPDLDSDPVKTFNQTATALAPADFYAVPGIRQARSIPVTYTLFHPSGDPLGSVRALYSPDGGGYWLPAVVTTDTITTHLSTTVLRDGFDRIALSQWDDLSGITVTTGVCGGAYGNGLSFDGTGTRSATTRDVDVSGGGTVYFALRIGDDSNLASCETADVGKDIVLEYSTNGGATWTTINTYTVGAYTDFTYIPESIPVAARTGSTRFRWRQPSHNPDKLDNWALDNVSVLPAHVYTWDVLASDFFGQSDNIVLRLEALPTQRPVTNSIPGPYQRPFVSAHTFPFRVRGTQVRVLSDTLPAANAIVYRLPAGQSLGGSPIIDSAGSPFRTDQHGYLQGRGQIGLGDRLVALLPITSTDSYTLYYTSASPTLTGLDAHTVTAAGIQTLTVSADNPLVLFDLDVSLQWDARNDARFMEPFKYNLERTSELLYDWTDGQAALGRVTIFHQRREWNYAHLRVYASNRVRPMAVKGGIASDIITEVITTTDVATLTYGLGQMHMGAVWNRYGEAGSELNEDWPRALAHELGHYALFLDDNYLGLDAEGHLIPVDTCPGAMSDPYREDYPYDEFHPDAGWLPPCQQTLSHRLTGRSDWGTITTFYPWLSQTITNTGPNNLPLAVTQIKEYDHAPDTPSTALEDPTFYLSEGGARVQPGTGTRAFMFQDDAELGGLWAIDLGQPKLDRILARGARPGDRVCVYELAAARLGCETVSVGDQQLELTTFTLEDWQPDIAISPVNSRTIDLGVTNVPTGLALNAQLFPVMTATVGTIPLTETGSGYTGTFHLLDPVLEGYVQVWVDESEPRRETITDFAVGGNPASMRGSGASMRGSGASMRGSGASMRGSGASMRGSGAPVISMDGQVILFVDETAFAPDEFYALQPVTVIPSPPEWATVVGKGYRVLATDNAPDLSTASINFTYMGEEVASGEEPWLRIYFWDGLEWGQLPTTLDLYQNSATALAQGEGLYALMSSFEIPLPGAGWNLVAYPLQEARPVTEALLSISGYYTTVYGYQAADTSDPWKVYDVTVPEWVNDLHTLEYGHGYWINVSQPITWRVNNASAQSLAADSGLPNPPATYYGQVLPGLDFTPSAGMAVTAWVSDALCSQSETLDVDGQVVYAVNVLAASVGNTAGCGVPGSIVTFQVDTQVMATTVAWDNNRVREVTLSSKARPAGRVYLPLIIKK